MHYKEPLNSFEIRVRHSPGFRLPSVAKFPWLCRKRRKAIFTDYSATTSYIYIYIPGIDIHLDGHCTEKSSIHQGQILLETGADLFGKPSVRLAFRVMILLGNQNIYTICGDHRLWRYRPGFFDCFGASISGGSCSAPLGRLVTVFLVLPVACGCLDHLPPWSALEPAGFSGATRP